MRIQGLYSHLNGHEYLLVHRKELWDEVERVIETVDAEACRTKVSRERTMRGRILYSPADMNNAFKAGFQANGWNERRNTFWVAPRRKNSCAAFTACPKLTKRRASKPPATSP